MEDFSKNALIAIDQDGNKIDATKKYSKLIKIEVKGETLLEEINNGTLLSMDDWKEPTFQYVRDIKSEIVERKANAAGKPSIVGSPVLPKYDTSKTNKVHIYDFSMIIENYDEKTPAARAIKFAAEMYKWQYGLNMKMLRTLMSETLTEVASYKLYQNKDISTRVNQPTQNSFTTTAAVKAIQAGKRIVEVNDLNSSNTNRYKIVKAVIEYLNVLGKKEGNSNEKNYPFAEGFTRNKIRIATDLEGMTTLRAELVQLTNDGTSVGILAKDVLEVKVVETNELRDNVKYQIQTTRSWDHNRQFMSQMGNTKIKMGSMYKDPITKEVDELPETTAKLKNTKAMSHCVLYEGEIFLIKEKVS